MSRPVLLGSAVHVSSTFKKKFSMLLISQCLCYQNLHRTLYQPLNVLKKTHSKHCILHTLQTLLSTLTLFICLWERDMVVC